MLYIKLLALKISIISPLTTLLNNSQLKSYSQKTIRRKKAKNENLRKKVRLVEDAAIEVKLFGIYSSVIYHIAHIKGGYNFCLDHFSLQVSIGSVGL